ncbi:MAG TPA: hypothetical protein DEG71_12060 [Clostridiales bacterium]|nr:hypothetical protein [Clostridiales bacterium]
MAVIVQEFKEPDFSGVWIGDDESSGMLEWVKGNGEKLVSGKVTPINEIWIDNNSSSEKIKVGGVSIGKKLIELQQKVVQDDMKIADFEWCILDNELVMLQYRPVTKQLLINKNIKITEMNVGNKEILYGIPASRGEAFGKSKFVNKLSDLDKWNEGDILMTGYTDPDWIEIMSKSSGIVAAVGGFLCHTAIIAREFDIPCVTGIGEDSIKRIWDKEYIYLNGDTGEVHIN